MSFKDQFFIIRNRLFEKKNIVLLIVLTIIFLILITCLTIVQFSVNNKNRISNLADGRTYKIIHEVIDDDINHTLRDVEFTEEQIGMIKNLEHVESIVNEKYYFGSRTEVSTFDIESEEGILYLKVLLNKDDIKIKKGTNLENKYELVCSDTFYPHEFDDRMYRNLFIPSSKFIGKEIEVISSNEDLDGKSITLKIVGSYENKYMETANTCYTDMETYNEISSKYAGWVGSYDEKGNLIEKEYSKYYDYFVVIDSKDNIFSVLDELKRMNIEYYPYSYTDFTFMNMLLIIPIVIGIVVIILTLNILYSFISKKNMSRLNNIGILKAIGYDEKDIILLNFKENTILIVICYIISLLIYFVALNFLTYTFWAEITYNNVILDVPYVLIAVLLILFIFIIYLIIKSSFKKIFNYSIQELLAMK
ncbi:MAG: FtsX-like permease family protein [Candidatus Coprovivens sp.]